jgi:FtsP/CotA-like multicopper oxidase with cupredoxin domain
MYHPHGDEMTQMAMGMMGFWVTHPKGRHPLIEPVDRDFVWLLSSFDIEPGAYTPKIMTMLDFNLWTFNNRIFPGIDSLNVRQGDRRDDEEVPRHGTRRALHGARGPRPARRARLALQPGRRLRVRLPHPGPLRSRHGRPHRRGAAGGR